MTLAPLSRLQTVLWSWNRALVESGWSDDVLDNPHHPYTQRLLRCLPMLKPLEQGVSATASASRQARFLPG
ncbi:hypothetical protein DMH17_15130 [Raoultella planticola]|nr:hypothetical protein [Raoultella planticola]